MRVERNISYGAEAAQRLDLFRPDAARNAPVLLDFHGGAWRAGNKSGRGHLGTTLTAKGVIWSPVEYGLAPGFGMDAIIDHTRQAVAWMYQNIENFGGNPERIYISGNSAGGHLAATMAMAGWQARYGLPADVIKGICAISGVYELEVLVGAPAGGPNDQLDMDMSTARRNSPIHNIPANAPPMIIAVGEPEAPDFKGQAYAFHQAWYAAGLPVTLMEVPNAPHFAMGRQLGDDDSPLHHAMMTLMGLTGESQ